MPFFNVISVSGSLVCGPKMDCAGFMVCPRNLGYHVPFTSLSLGEYALDLLA